MTQTASPLDRFQIKTPRPATVIVVAIVIVVGLTALFFARRAIDPLDRFVTAQMCSGPGDEVFRPVEEAEASNRFALVDRREGWCLFGPVDQVLAEEAADELDDDEEPPPLSAGAQILAAADPAAEVQVAVPDLEPGSLYRAWKWMNLLLQFGAASFAVRLVADPLFDRFIRRHRRRARRNAGP
ncbi:MAG: hypothetical protein AAF962_20500 [Actinomycetota bacterium]